MLNSLMKYLSIIFVRESHPFCLKMLPLYVGNLQVIKFSRSLAVVRRLLMLCRRDLIRNGMGI